MNRPYFSFTTGAVENAAIPYCDCKVCQVSVPEDSIETYEPTGERMCPDCITQTTIEDSIIELENN